MFVIFPILKVRVIFFLFFAKCLQLIFSCELFPIVEKSPYWFISYETCSPGKYDNKPYSDRLKLGTIVAYMLKIQKCAKSEILFDGLMLNFYNRFAISDQLKYWS